MRRIIHIIIILLCSVSLHAQYNTAQNRVWVFGYHTGVDFNSGSPVVFTSGIVSGILQGSAMVSNNAGDLLFYTNGKTVWNKQHDTMPGGAAIVPFNTYYNAQPSVIVPVSGSLGKYYIFSMETSLDYNVSSRSHLAYSIIDMSLDGGLGDVTATKGVILDSMLSRKMVVIAGNNCDYWLMVYKRYSSQFLCYHITSSGIDMTPVVSPGTGVDSGGTIKVSPDRRFVVNVNDAYPNSSVALCDLDALNGTISGCRVISNIAEANAAEFSPNSTKLYVNEGTLHQYDISLPSTSAIIASRYAISFAEADLRLAPDGRIYAAEAAPSPTQFLNCIRNPDLSGPACNYVYHALSVSPGFETHVLPAIYWSPIMGIVPGPITGDTSVCVGATIALSDSILGGSWTSSNTTIATVNSGGLVSGITPGITTISYGNGCGITSVTITVNPTPLLAPAVATVCIGGSITLSFGPTGGTWSESVTSIVTVFSDGTVHADNVGATVLTYTLPGNCYSTTSIAVNDIPVIGPASIRLCANDATALSYAPAGGIWTSSAPGLATVDAGAVLHGISGGAAVVSYSLGGCTAMSTVTISPAPDVTPQSSQVCIGSTLQLSSSVSWGIWSSSDDAVASLSAVAQVHAVSVGAAIISYAAIGCIGLATISVRPPPSAITGRALLCQGYITALSNGVPGGMWSSAATAIVVIDTAGYVTGVAPGSALISYTTASGAGCTALLSVTVVASAGGGSISGPPFVCSGGTATYTNSLAGGGWSCDNAGVATVSAAGMVTGLTPGVVTITYTITDTCGLAIAVKTIAIGTSPDAGTIVGDTLICTGSTVILSDTAAGGNWYAANTAVAAVNSFGAVTGSSPGITTIGYYLSNSCGADTALHTVRISPGPPVLPIAGLSHVCIGADFRLSNASPGGTWTSLPIGVIALSADGDVSAVGQGVRTVSYTVGPTADGCYSMATYSVTVGDARFATAAIVTQPLCYGLSTGAIALSVAGSLPPYRYLWSTLDTIASVAQLPDGVYYSSVTEVLTNCTVQETFQIAAPTLLAVAVTITADVCNTGRGNAQVVATGGISPYTYAWSTGAQGNEIAALHTGLYTVSVMDANGCKQDTSAVLTDSCFAINIHDVITPNGDGVNDVWIIEGLSPYPANTVQLFSKWGDRLFEATNYQNNWSATGNNGPLPDGTYFYIIQLNAPSLHGTQTTFTGSILVKR